jgi:NADPH-dependent glutamate synthase beta subunit-like oxidoreductase/pyruvate/2-oxoacid:ferredoxin oxidoreductase beta subunit
LERIPALEQEAETWAQIFEGSNDLAVITSGASFLHAREAFKDATILKLGMTNPIPRKLISEFAKDKKRILVIEELEPYLEEQIRALHIPCEGKNKLPRYGELSVELLHQSFLDSPAESDELELPPIPPRPPVLCAGCAHRGPFYVLGQLDAIVSGDIGCYTLGALAPLDAMDTCMSMGASVGIAHGMEKVMTEEERQRLVSVIGDSTFFHSGITGLVDVLYNGGHTTTIILDNRTTAMTGHQEHPGSGLTLQKDKTAEIDLEALCKGLGIKRVTRVDPYDLVGMWQTLDKELHVDEPSVILAEANCALQKKLRFGDPVSLDREKCTECMACTLLGCPAIELKQNHLEISDLLCVGCVHCGQICSDCNAGIDLPQVLELVHQKRYHKAFSVLLKTNPLPAVSSRVCPRPCDHETNALGYDQALAWAEKFPNLLADFSASGQPTRISACAVEKFLGDYGIADVADNEFAPLVEQVFSVGIIGAGPAGLSAAWQLRQKGIPVTVYEAFPEPGGMLRYGIPEFRLPKALLKKEIDRLVAVGVVFCCNTHIGKDLSFDRVTGVHDATIVCVGNGTPKKLTLDGLTNVKEGVLYGVDFLRRVNRDLPSEIGKKIGVIGGGNTAIDCARSARRLDAEVTVYYRRGQDDMTAIPEEIDAARKSGVRFEFHASPVALLQKEGCLTGAEIQPMKPGPLDNTGRHRPQPSEDSAFQTPMDTIILAVGEQSDLNFLEDSKVAFSKNVEVNFIGATTLPGVFACGDAAFDHGTVTQAISTGRRAAEAVDAYLKEQKGNTP